MKYLLLFMLSFVFQSQVYAHTLWGNKVYVGKGYARSYVEFEKDGSPKSIGIAMTSGALHHLPAHDKEYLLDLPEGTFKPYKFISMNWNPHGHEPDNIYTLPHFDYHFYLINRDEQIAITCTASDASVCVQEPSAENKIDHYAPTPAGVPQMGWHWVDLLSGEFNGEKFTKTFLYGYYSGKIIFIEPMITVDFLNSKNTSISSIRRPQQFSFNGYYPSEMKISYDKKTGLHKIVLQNLAEY